MLPVRTRNGRAAVLKIGGAELEHLALTRWDGDGAVRLLRADPHRRAVLLEPLAGPDLADVWDVEACEIVAGLYARLHRPVGAPFDRLSTQLASALVALEALGRDAPLPRRMVEQALALGKDFVADEATDGVLVHTDLHYGNVLADHDGSWRAIAPQPLSGDPHYEIAPMLRHRFDELAGDVRDGVRRRFHALVDTADLDEHRARDWVVVRMMLEALVGPPELRTTCVAVAKAVQD